MPLYRSLYISTVCPCIQDSQDLSLCLAASLYVCLFVCLFVWGVMPCQNGRSYPDVPFCLFVCLFVSECYALVITIQGHTRMCLFFYFLDMFLFVCLGV